MVQVILLTQSVSKLPRGILFSLHIPTYSFESTQLEFTVGLHSVQYSYFLKHIFKRFDYIHRGIEVLSCSKLVTLYQAIRKIGM